MIKTTMMLVILVTEPEAKRTLTEGVFLIAIQTTVMMKVMV